MAPPSAVQPPTYVYRRPVKARPLPDRAGGHQVPLPRRPLPGGRAEFRTTAARAYRSGAGRGAGMDRHPHRDRNWGRGRGGVTVSVLRSVPLLSADLDPGRRPGLVAVLEAPDDLPVLPLCDG